ncbi:MAG: DUF6265 family protein [Roseateles sp.]|uniref:DUF6265 family protein n=1 Tax=Roseateles sp. TaxID=1971397 RepID=UPI00403828EF
MKAISALLPVLLAAAGTTAQADPFAPVAWMAGCWERQGPDGSMAGSVEQWMAPAGGLMLGMARTLKNGRAIEFEFMQIRADADGRLIYIAQPQGRPPTSFKLLSSGDAQAVFENAAHDFPQRVIYRLAAPDQLAARIEGLRQGQPRGIDFAMRRAPCP